GSRELRISRHAVRILDRAIAGHPVRFLRHVSPPVCCPWGRNLAHPRAESSALWRTGAIDYKTVSASRMEPKMKLPSRIVDISSTLDTETVLDHPFMRPKIEYLSHQQTAPLLCGLFPGLKPEDLPAGEGWAYEHVQLTTHNGTHMDAPVHFQSKSVD